MTIWKTPCPMCKSDMVWVGFAWDEHGYRDYWKCFGDDEHRATERCGRGEMPKMPPVAYATPKEADPDAPR